MFTVEILRKDETSSIERANLARHNHGHDGNDILLVFDNGELVRIETIYGACQQCKKQIKTIDDAREHMEAHLNHPSYSCPMCNAMFDTQQEIITHITTHQIETEV